MLAVALVLAACDAPREESSATSSPTSEPTQSETPVDDLTSPPEELLPDPGRTDLFSPGDDVLTVAVKQPRTLDPMRIADPASILVARQLYEGLTRWDPVKERVVPAGAQSWTRKDGGRRFVFELRSDLRFHDGTPVTSEDFRFAFDRIANKRNASDLAFTLEQVKGFERVNQLGKSKSLSGLKTPDQNTLVIELTEPMSEFPGVLTHPGLVPLKASDVREYDRFLSQPVGNGPFRMAEPWEGSGPVFLEAFPDAVNQPNLDGIGFIPYKDAANSWLPFLEGDVDVAEVPAGRIKAAEQEFGDRGYVPILTGSYFGLNLDSKELGDLRLRVAISRAIDRAELAKKVFKGTLAGPRGIAPRGMPGFTKNVCGDLCRYSPRVARGLIKRIKKKDRRVTIEYNRDRTQRRVTALVKRDLEKVGLDVKLKSYPFDRYLELLSDDRLRMYRLGWIAEYPSPAVFLRSLFQSKSPDNHSGFSSKKVDALLRRAAREGSTKKRSALYVKAEKRILRQVPIVPLGSFVMRWAAQPYVKDVGFDVMGGFDAFTVSLEQG